MLLQDGANCDALDVEQRPLTEAIAAESLPLTG